MVKDEFEKVSWIPRLPEKTSRTLEQNKSDYSNPIFTFFA